MYIKQEEMKIALQEMTRVVKHGGIILVQFQKEKGIIANLARLFVNLKPLKIFVFIIKIISFIFLPYIRIYA